MVFVVITFFSSTVPADINVIDDTGASVSLDRPARRIVSLAPHVTELLFAAGAGAFTVGVTTYSDFPEAARRIPRIGSGIGLDLEAILALQPDLVVAWASGNPRSSVEQLRRLGLKVYVTEPRQLEHIARDIERIGQLAGTTEVAERTAGVFRVGYGELSARYSGRAPIRVFYQVLDPTLMTINGQHLISQIMSMCGGQNLFADLPILASAIDKESVLKANPEVIVAGGTEPLWRDWHARWLGFRNIRAVQHNQLYFIPADALHRHSPRILTGARLLCEAIDQARGRD